MTPDPPPSDGPSANWKWLAFTWGLAEAVFFFIVPDVLSSRLVLQDARRGFLACLFSVVGALLGGLFLYSLADGSAPALAAMDYIPGISAALIEQSRRGLEQQGLMALFSGAFSGIPYKLYAVQAAAITDAGIGVFMLFSLAARLLRFCLVTGLVWCVGALLGRLTTRAKLRLHTVAWALFYTFYFWKMGV